MKTPTKNMLSDSDMCREEKRENLEIVIGGGLGLLI